MSAHILKGTKEEIAQQLVQLAGEVREAIVFVDERPLAETAGDVEKDDLFAEMIPYMVNARNVDDSRESFYTQMEGE